MTKITFNFGINSFNFFASSTPVILPIRTSKNATSQELSFAKYLSDNNIPIWIRQVIIPGVTDNKDDLLELKKFINTLKNVEKIELLPYHDLGKFKWSESGEIYELDNINPPTQDDIDKANLILDIE